MNLSREKVIVSISTSVHSLKQSTLPSSVHFNSKTESSNLGIASLFNDFFQSVFNSSSVLPSTPRPDAAHSLDCLDELLLSVDEVHKSLNDLDSSKAMGIDNIHNHVLKSCSISLARPIHYIFSCCIQQSYLPLEWRTHKIVPIFKSGDRGSVKNYRPISLLCCSAACPKFLNAWFTIKCMAIFPPISLVANSAFYDTDLLFNNF